MKNENIPAEVKSKSLKEARDEINDILNKLESKEADLADSLNDYKRLIQLIFDRPPKNDFAIVSFIPAPTAFLQ